MPFSAASEPAANKADKTGFILFQVKFARRELSPSRGANLATENTEGRAT